MEDGTASHIQTILVAICQWDSLCRHHVTQKIVQIIDKAVPAIHGPPSVWRRTMTLTPSGSLEQGSPVCFHLSYNSVPNPQKQGFHRLSTDWLRYWQRRWKWPPVYVTSTIVRKTTIFAEGISACKGNAIHFIPFPCESVPLQTGPCPKCQNCPINENIETTNCVVYVLYDDYSISSLFLFVIVHVTVKAFQRTMSACRHCHRPKVLHRS